MIHPFNEKRRSSRLLWEYQHYDKLIVGIDFDNTIRPGEIRARINVSIQ